MGAAAIAILGGIVITGGEASTFVSRILFSGAFKFGINSILSGGSGRNSQKVYIVKQNDSAIVASQIDKDMTIQDIDNEKLRLNEVFGVEIVKIVDQTEVSEH